MNTEPAADPLAKIVAERRTTDRPLGRTTIRTIYEWRVKTETVDLYGTTHTQWGATHEVRRALRVSKKAGTR